MNEDPVPFTAITHRRTALGLSQRELADLAGVSARSIHNLEHGKNWPLDVNRARIEKALGWAPGSLDSLREGGEPQTLEEQATPPSIEDRNSRRAREVPPPEGFKEETPAISAPGFEKRLFDTQDGNDIGALREAVRIIDTLPPVIQGVILSQAREEFFTVSNLLSAENDRRLILFAFELLDEQEREDNESSASDASSSPRMAATPPILLSGDLDSLAYVADSSPDEPEMGDDGYHDGP